MQSSYNVFKRHQVSANTVYTIEAPMVKFVPEDSSLDEADAEDELDAYSRQLIGEAEAKARNMLMAAASEAERMKKEAWDTAFKKGYNEGMKKGLEDGLKSGTEKGYKDTEDIRKKADDVLKEAHRISREYIEGRKEEIINLSMTIAEKVIGYQADTNDSIIINIAKNALAGSVIREQVVIRVNPMDYALLDCRRDEIIKMAGEDKIISIIRDDDIGRGGCRLDTGASFVDAAVDVQLQKIREALQG